MEDPRVRQRVVASDRHEPLGAEALEVLEHDRCQVVAILVDLQPGPALRREMGRQAGRPHPRRIGPRRMEDRPAGPVDRPGRDPVERPDVLRIGLGSWPLMGQALPATPDPEDLGAHLGRPIDDALDDRVQPWDVATTGEDGDPARCGHAGMTP